MDQVRFIYTLEVMLIKRIIYSLIALMLGISSVGFTITEHYCGQRLVDSAINSEPESCCEGPCDCCHNESTYIHLEEDFTPSLLVISPTLEPIVVDFHYFMSVQSLLFSFEAIVSDAPPEYPPPSNSPTPFSFIQVFLC